jgi:myb proto-oncogene protein
MVAKQLKGRSENCIKNRFYSCLRHKYLNVKHPYYQVPEKKAKLNDEESQKNAIPDTIPHKEVQN